jgi:hypothetical protein
MLSRKVYECKPLPVLLQELANLMRQRGEAEQVPVLGVALRHPPQDLRHFPVARVTRYNPISICEIDEGYRYGISDINGNR